MQLIRIILNIISYWPDLVALIVKVKVIATDIRQLHIYTIRLEKERESAGKRKRGCFYGAQQRYLPAVPQIIAGCELLSFSMMIISIAQFFAIFTVSKNGRSELHFLNTWII